MWSYYGTKTKLAPLYPRPIHNRIIEPFAGAAKYSLLHFENDVLLIDEYPVIIQIWKYLQKCSPKDILGLPDYKVGDTIELRDLDCIEQYELLRFLLQEGTVGGNKVYEMGLKSYDAKRKKIAANLFKIKHWKFECKSYIYTPNYEATWFIDPPYQFGGHKYVHSSKKINFKQLADFCKERKGQVIVCETMRANWLPFVPLTRHVSTNNKAQTEAIWTNYHTHFNNVQTTIF
jgi:hypothetical protein